MHEVVTLSFSQRSNCIATHFYNIQEASLYDANRPHSGVHLATKKGQGQTYNFYPRALLWDYSNGFGALTKFEYFEPKVDINALSSDFSNVIHVGEQQAKNSYQSALDQGTAVPQDAADKSQMKYWSDFSRVIYRPESLLSLNKWEYSFKNGHGHLRSHPEILFNEYGIGCEEFEENEEAGVESVETNFRKVLEDCDTVNGLNLITELDSAWAGFSSSCLSLIQDEYLPKSPVLVWSLTDDRPLKSLQLPMQLSRVKSMMALVKNSSLFLPISTSPSVLPDWADQKSQWQVSSFQVVPFQLVNSLSTSTGELRASLNEFAGGLTCGDDSRNIVSDIRLDGGLVSPERIFPADKQVHVFEKSVIAQKHEKENSSEEEYTVRQYTPPLPFNNSLDSFPKRFRELKDPFSECSFEVTDKPKKALGEMLNVVSRYCRDDEREDLKEEIAELQEAYQWGFEDDSDYD